MDVSNRNSYIMELDQMNPVEECEEVVEYIPPPVILQPLLDASVPDVPETPKRTRKAAKPDVHHHPTYVTMIKGAILELNNTKGASKAAILKYIAQHYQLGENLSKINSHLRLALKKGTEHGEFIQTKGHGASGSFKVSPAHNANTKVHVDIPKKIAAKPTKAKATKKARTAKPAAPKKTVTKRAAPKRSGKKESEMNKKVKKVGKKPRAKTTKRTKTAKKTQAK